MVTDFFSHLDKPNLTVVPEGTPTRGPAEGVHPYAAAAIRYELDRLDQLPRPWHEGANWDTTTFEVACNLLEFANSPWAGYTHADAEADLHAHAPADGAWGPREHATKWKSARQKVGAQSRPQPADQETFTPPSVTVLDIPTLEPGLSPLLNKIIDWHELFATDDDGEDWILEPLLPARRMVALYSAPKAGKSLLMLELAVAIATGGEALGTTVQEPRRVLYVDFENDPRGDIRQRLEAMEYGPNQLDGLCYLTYPQLAKLDTPQGGQDLLLHVQHYDCEVVVIDTVSRAVAGEENENDTWLAFYRNTGLLLKQHGIACIRLDHSGKDRDKGMRGGSAKYGDVDAVWRLTALSEDTIRLECTDHRMPVGNKDLTLIREEYPLRHRAATTTWQAVADVRALEVDRALDRLGVPADASVRTAAKALRDAGEKAENKAIRDAVRIRKTRLDITFPGVPGTPPAHPGTPGADVPGAEPPFRGSAGTPPAARRTGTAHPPKTDHECDRCGTPIGSRTRAANDGYCGRCYREMGLA